MSAPAASSSPEIKDVERRKSLGKYVKRMSSVFKREKPTKTDASPSTAAPAATAEKKKKKQTETTTAAPAASPAPAPVPAPPAATKEPVTQEINRGALQQERARALFAKYNLTLETHEWISTAAQPISVQRVEKPIRMRVHRTCHHCGTTYGADKVCVKCEHKRCKKCPRYPKKRVPGEKGKQAEPEETPKKKKKLLTVTNKAGQDRVYQPPRQRVRRTCHKCQALFIPPTATTCEQCQHTRCTKCPREPAKLAKFPNGYPGDAAPDSETEVEPDVEQVRRIWRKPRTRVRWECEECHSLFIEGSPLCPGCGHERCEKCTRMPLKRAKKEPQFNPDVIRAVEEKLRALEVDDEPPAPRAT